MITTSKEPPPKRANFIISPELETECDKLRIELRKVGAMTITNSTIFREGAALYIAKMRKEIKAALKGKFHAKPR